MNAPAIKPTFSALGRAVWDETCGPSLFRCCPASLSVLSVEPYGMKLLHSGGRRRMRFQLSVLSVEPYGMKPLCNSRVLLLVMSFSALGRAVWDETALASSNITFVGSFSALGRAVWDETSAAGG